MFFRKRSIRSSDSVTFQIWKTKSTITNVSSCNLITSKTSFDISELKTHIHCTIRHLESSSVPNCNNGKIKMRKETNTSQKKSVECKWYKLARSTTSDNTMTNSMAMVEQASRWSRSETVRINGQSSPLCIATDGKTHGHWLALDFSVTLARHYTHDSLLSSVRITLLEQLKTLTCHQMFAWRLDNIFKIDHSFLSSIWVIIRRLPLDHVTKTVT